MWGADRGRRGRTLRSAGAILFVRVPATIMISLWGVWRVSRQQVRGVGRSHLTGTRTEHDSETVLVVARRGHVHHLCSETSQFLWFLLGSHPCNNAPTAQHASPNVCATEHQSQSAALQNQQGRLARPSPPALRLSAGSAGQPAGRERTHHRPHGALTGPVDDLVHRAEGVLDAVARRLEARLVRADLGDIERVRRDRRRQCGRLWCRRDRGGRGGRERPRGRGERSRQSARRGKACERAGEYSECARTAGMRTEIGRAHV